MKKMMAMLLAMYMCFAFAACGGTDSNDDEVQNDENNVQQQVEHDETQEVVVGLGESQNEENNTANIIEVELTAENFDTYFELVEVSVFSENEFGEIDEMSLYQYYLVREEYSVSDMSSFAVEYSCVWGRKNCEVDFVNQTYVLSEFNDTVPPATVINDRFYDIEVDGQERFGFSIDGSGKSIRQSYGTVGEVGYSVDFEIIRVTGTLFLEA